MKLSVILPTFSPDLARLRRVLAALHAQTLGPGEWETLLVDNASPVPVPDDVFPPGLAARIVREPLQGLSHARAAGIRAARGDVLVFVDDDNVLDPAYLATACRLLEEHPRVGAAGGVIVPEFATPPPPWAVPHLSMLALRDFGSDRVLFSPDPPAPADYPYLAPFGAGLVIRRSAALAYLDWAETDPHPLLDRVGRRLGGCGDCELILKGVLHRGLLVAYEPRLRLTHLIPAGRLAYRYFTRLQFEGGISWGRFCVRHGLRKPASRWSVPLRAARAAFVTAAWTRSGRLHFLRALGEWWGASAPAPRPTPRHP